MSFWQTVLITLTGFHEVAYTGICECKLHGHEPRVWVFWQTVLISLTGFYEVAYTIAHSIHLLRLGNHFSGLGAWQQPRFVQRPQAAIIARSTPIGLLYRRCPGWFYQEPSQGDPPWFWGHGRSHTGVTGRVLLSSVAKATGIPFGPSYILQESLALAFQKLYPGDWLMVLSSPLLSTWWISTRSTCTFDGDINKGSTWKVFAIQF